MGKIRSKESNGTGSDARRAKSKKKDPSGTTEISTVTREKYKWILQKPPFVVCEKLHDSKVSTVSKTSNSHTLTIKNVTNNPNIIRLAQKNSKPTKDSTSFKVTSCESQNKNKESKRILTPNDTLKTSSLQALEKRSKVKNKALQTESLPSTSQEKVNDKYSVSGRFSTTEEGSSEEELRQIENRYKRVSGRSKLILKVCTRDPNRITPCDKDCCIKFAKKDESWNKKSNKRENENSSWKRETNSGTFKANSSHSSKLDSQRKTVVSTERKRSKDRKRRTKAKETRQKPETQIIEVPYTSPAISQRRKMLPFTSKQSKDGSSCSFISDISPQIPMIPRINATKPSSLSPRYYINHGSDEYVRTGITFSLAPSNNSNFNSQISNNNQPLQTKATLYSKPLKLNFEKSSCGLQVLTKRTKPKDYFPDLNVGGTCVSETKTNHPKANVNTQSQNQMLEGAIFPKNNEAPHSSNQPSFKKFQQNYASNNPLSCEENETNVARPTNFGKNRFNRIENQCLNQENRTVFLKNSIQRYSTSKAVTNDTEYFEKDRLRDLAVRVCGTSGDTVEIHPDVNKVKAEVEISTTGSDLLCTKNRSLLGNQISYPECLQHRPLPAPLEIPQEDLFSCEFSNDSRKMDDINSHIEEHIIPNILPQNKPKIMKCETIPSDCIKLLSRPQTTVRNGDLCFKDSGRITQTLENENSTGDQQKVAIIKINNTEQLLNNDLQRSFKSLPCDDNMDGDNLLNLGLTETQASGMLNSNMVSDLDNVLKNGLNFFNCDDLLGDDMVNNQKIPPQSTGHIIDVSQPVEIKESKPFSDIEKVFENNEKMVTQTNGEFSSVNNCLNNREGTTYTASNLDGLNSVAGTSENVEDFPSIKKPDWNSPNSASQGLNNHFSFSSNSRKRRWFNEKQKSGEQSSEKKIKLKRRKWNYCANEGEYTDTSSEISSSCKSSFNDADLRVIPYAEIYGDIHSNLQVHTEETGSDNCVVENDSQPYNFTDFLVVGRQKDVNKNGHKVKDVVPPIFAVKAETKVQPELETNGHSRIEMKVPPNLETNAHSRIEMKVQLELSTNVHSRIETEAESSFQTSTKIESKFQRNVESNFKTKEVCREASPTEELPVDPEPEPEQGDSDTQPRRVGKAENSPIRRKKRRSGYRSKFSPKYYSNSSSESSDEEFTKKNSSSEDEVESKNNLLKARLQRELNNIQEISENSNSQIIETPISCEDEQDIQDDILSVIASPSLMLMDTAMSSSCPSPVQFSKVDRSSDYSNITGDSYFDTFKRKNLEECSRDLRSFIDFKQGDRMDAKKQAGSSLLADNSDTLFTKPFPPLNKVKTQNEPLPQSSKKVIVFDSIPTVNRPPVPRIFYGVCHRFLSTGLCTKKICPYPNNIPDKLKVFNFHSDEFVFNLMCDGINARLQFFIQSVYKNALKKLNNAMCLKLFTGICNANLLTVQILDDTVEVLWQKQGPIGKVVREIVEQPLKPELAPVCFSQLLLNVANRAPKNEYWETLRPLIDKVVFSSYILEQILIQCINDRGNESRIEEVYAYLVQTEAYKGVRKESWISFCKLRGELEEKRTQIISQNLNARFYNNGGMTVNQGIASPDTGVDHQSPSYHIDDFNNPEDPVDMEICNTPDSDKGYKLLPIEDLAPPQSSIRERDHFWKFYDHLESLKNGLKHKDYDHVINILKQYVNTERTLFIRHWHTVLALEVNKSQVHVENTIKKAVQTGELFELREILYRLGTCVLITLADQGLWLHAYELLKTLQTFNLHEKNAGFILLAAEICLANHRHLKALTLLKQNDIIFTNWKKWKVKSNQGDVHLRTSTVTLLLESLCQDFAEKAFFIFDLILGEQPSNCHPIDLTRVVDKLMVSLIAQNHIDLVMNLCKKAMRYHLNFHETTFRAVITALVPNDLILARQFYQYATHLGVYSSVKVYPVTHVIINVDWSEEEMYIVVVEFLRKLFLNIGFAASHLGPNQLGVFFIFEIVPERKQLYSEQSDSKRAENKKINKSKSMMREILQSRFDPPIRFVKKEQGRICKIKSRSLVEYLQAGHIAA